MQKHLLPVTLITNFDRLQKFYVHVLLVCTKSTAEYFEIVITHLQWCDWPAHSSNAMLLNVISFYVFKEIDN